MLQTMASYEKTHSVKRLHSGSENSTVIKYQTIVSRDLEQPAVSALGWPSALSLHRLLRISWRKLLNLVQLSKDKKMWTLWLQFPENEMDFYERFQNIGSKKKNNKVFYITYSKLLMKRFLTWYWGKKSLTLPKLDQKVLCWWFCCGNFYS